MKDNQRLRFCAADAVQHDPGAIVISGALPSGALRTITLRGADIEKVLRAVGVAVRLQERAK